MLPRSRFRLITVLSTCLIVSAIGVGSASAATISNGDFETSDLSGWTVFNEPGSGGNWFNYTGTTAPIGPVTIPAPAGGARAAVTDQNEASTSVLYQDVVLEPGQTHTLKYDYFFLNMSVDLWEIPSPDSFSFQTPDNQQFAIDVTTTAASPMTTNPAEILASSRRAAVTDPSAIDWTTATIDLTPLAGQTVRFRYVNVNNQSPLFTGLDNVSITSVATPPASVDTSPAVLETPTLSKTKFPSTGSSRGTTISLTSDEAGTATIKFYKATKGKRSGKKCAKRSKRLAKKKNCTRWVKVRGSISSPVVAGQNSIAFSGRVDGKALAPGKYKMEIVVVNAVGLTSSPVTKTFTITKPKRKR